VQTIRKWLTWVALAVFILVAVYFAALMILIGVCAPYNCP